jgi:hypothetical protein
MAVRVTASDVLEIMEVDPAVTDLSPFIIAANAVINNNCTDITEADATIVERWLSAHFVTVRDMRAASEGAGSVSVSYQYKTDLALNASMYGQMAMILDTTGGLSAWNKSIVNGVANRSVGITWLGSVDVTPDSDL